MVRTLWGKLAITLVVAIVVLILALGIWVKPPPSSESVAPSVQLVDSRLVGRKEGVKQWEITTRSVIQADDLVTLRELDQITIFQDEQPYWFIRADWATWQRKRDILELHGPVEVDGADDFKLIGDKLIWTGAESTLTSPGPVLIKWDDMQIRAGQMIFATEDDLVYLEEQVEIVQDGYLFRLERAVYNLEGDLLEFYGELELEMEVRGDG